MSNNREWGRTIIASIALLCIAASAAWIFWPAHHGQKEKHAAVDKQHGHKKKLSQERKHNHDLAQPQ
jgi:hypothetical protein